MSDLKGYTPIYSFPYPLSGDSVANTYLRIQELAERIESTYTILDINLSGATKLMQQGDAAGGDLSGTYPSPSIASGAVNNTKIAANAAIAYSKLNLANSIISSDIVDGTITGSDIVSSVSLGGNPTTTTQSVVDNSSRIATTEFVQDLFAESQGTAFDTHVQNVTDAHDIDIPSIVYTTDTGTVTSTMIANNTIVNADINTAAAISYSKLALNNSILESDLAFSIATQAELDAHTGASTSVHGITNTANLVYTSDSRLTDARTPTGGAGGVLSGTYPNPGFAVDMATQSELDTVSGNLSTHESDTTSVHGIADTSVLATATDVSTAVSTHSSDTTSVHGISNTADLVLTGDARLSDARTPTSHAGTHVPGGSDAIDLTKIIAVGATLPTLPNALYPAGTLFGVGTIAPYLLYRSTGSAWDQIGGAGGSSVTTSDTAPSTPSDGDLWYKTSNAKTYVWYEDGSSDQWVEVGAASQLVIPQHGSSHVRGGADVIDGDRLTVDYVPSRYTRNSAASGAGDATDLTAHLSGVDNSLNSLWVPPGCCVRRSAVQSIANNSTVALSWDTELYDTDTMWSSGTDITIKTAGIYLISFYANFGLNNATGLREIAVYKNSSLTYYPTISQTSVPQGSYSHNVTASGQVNLAVNDVITGTVYQNYGSSMNVTGSIALTWLGKTS